MDELGEIKERLITLEIQSADWQKNHDTVSESRNKFIREQLECINLKMTDVWTKCLTRPAKCSEEVDKKIQEKVRSVSRTYLGIPAVVVAIIAIIEFLKK